MGWVHHSGGSCARGLGWGGIGMPQGRTVWGVDQQWAKSRSGAATCTGASRAPGRQQCTAPRRRANPARVTPPTASPRHPSLSASPLHAAHKGWLPQVLPNEFNWGDQLRDSLTFLDAQKSGRLPADNPISWRGNSALSDAAPDGTPLVGGFYIDGGEHNFFIYTLWL